MKLTKNSVEKWKFQESRNVYLFCEVKSSVISRRMHVCSKNEQASAWQPRNATLHWRLISWKVDRKRAQRKEGHCNAMLPNTAQYKVRGLLITVKEGWLSFIYRTSLGKPAHGGNLVIGCTPILKVVVHRFCSLLISWWVRIN